MSFFSRLYSFFISSISNHRNEYSILKKHERNYSSALCTMFAIATLTVSLADYRWFWLKGGLCNSKYIGLNMFLPVGKLFVIRAPIPWDSSALPNDIYQYKPNDSTELTGCVNTSSILIIRLMITFICLAIISSLIGFLLDALGTMRYGWKFMRRNALWKILSVILCTIVIGLCFYVSELIYYIQDKTRLKIGRKVEVQYDISYYLLIISNCLLLLSISFTLLKKYPTDDEENFQRIIDDLSRREQPLFIERSLPAVVTIHHDRNEPPPAYHSEADHFVL